jgi:hypothetical protein
VVTRPNKVEETLAKKSYTRGCYQGKVNLAEDGLIGPFNLSTTKEETYRIDQEVWKILEKCKEVKERRLDISDLNTVTPLK